jgi:hypothetical protein
VLHDVRLPSPAAVSAVLPVSTTSNLAVHSPNLMRLAPPVRVRGRGGPLWRAAAIGLPALAVASLGAWASQTAGLSGGWALVLASKLAALTAAGLAIRRPSTHELAWNGQAWQVDGQPTRVQVMLDLGPLLLLRLRPNQAAAGAELADRADHVELAARPERHQGAPDKPVHWLPLAASEAGPAWGALRAAVYARPSQAPPAPRPPGQQAS